MLMRELISALCAPLLLSMVFLAIGAWGVFDVHQRKAFYDNSERTIGTVKDFSCSGKTRGGCTAYIAVQLQGQLHRIEAPERPSRTFGTGTVADVAYRRDPAGKIEARLIQSPFRGQNVVPMILGFGGFLISAFAAYVSLSVSPEWRKRMRRRARRRKNAANPSVKRTRPGKPG